MATLEICEGGTIPVRIGKVEKVRLEEMLGMGGFGSAWRVRDTETSRQYVLKIIQGIKPGSVMAERVRLEAEVDIPSDHVVKSIGLREWDASTFLILSKYYRGRSLDKLVEEGVHLRKKQKRRIFKQVLMGTRDAHRCNVIHRDLKPANVLVEDEGHVRLLDFGISKFKGKNLTISGDILGTPPYMAPELIISGAKTADARSDIFSLGQILYELAMGEHFWRHQGWAELGDLIAFLTRTPPPTEVMDLAGFSCGFYDDAARVILKATKLDPGQRYQSVGGMMSDLGYVPGLTPIPTDLHLRSPLLIVESGDDKGERTLLDIPDGGCIKMGRDKADIILSYDSVSRPHLAFSRSGDVYSVQDLGSKNGTMVGGIALSPGDPPFKIRHADRIKIGDVFLRFVLMLR
jgi:serine/threonine-protein kinase